VAAFASDQRLGQSVVTVVRGEKLADSPRLSPPQKHVLDGPGQRPVFLFCLSLESKDAP
jgi:hypothetical protein